MSDYFQNVVSEGDSGKESLKAFLSETMRLLCNVVYSDDVMRKLFGKDQYIAYLAKETFEQDVKPAVEKMMSAVDRMKEEVLQLHGLLGLAASFKLEALKLNARRWRRYSGQLTVGKTFIALFQAVDVILDSLIDAIGTGLGGLVKEFKDMLMSCAFVKA